MSGVDRVWVPRADQVRVLEQVLPRRKAAIWACGGSGKTAMACTWMLHWMQDAFEVGRALIVAPPLVARDGWPAEVRRWAHLEPLRDMAVLGPDDIGLTAGDLLEWKEGNDPNGEDRMKVVPRRALPEPLGGDESAEEVARHWEEVAKAVAGLPGGSRVASAIRQGWTIHRRASGHTPGDKASAKKALLARRERVHVVSWSFWPWLVQTYGKNFPYDLVVFDESSFLRDQGSERYKAAEWVRKVGRTTHVLELTASPASNHQEAVYSQLDLLEPGHLGDTLTAFRETYCVPERMDRQSGRVYSWRVSGAMRPAFEAKCAELAVSVPSTLDVPLLHVEHWLDLPTGVASEAYEAISETQVWGDIVCGSAAVRQSKLRQIASGWVYKAPDLLLEEDSEAVFVHDVKIAKVLELVEGLGRPAIIAFEFKEELARLRKAFGKRLKDIRDRGAKDAFIAGKIDLLALHPASAGHGVDGLQNVCCDIVWMTCPQDLELFTQANWRVHRQGTAAPTVYCHMLLTRGTEEERIWRDVLPAKRQREDRLLAATSI